MMMGRLPTNGGHLRMSMHCIFFTRTLILGTWGAHLLLKHGAVLQHFGSRGVLEDTVIETSELLSHVLASPAS